MIFRTLDTWIQRIGTRSWHQPWYGLARSLLGLATLLTFVGNSTELLFFPALEGETGPICRSDRFDLNLFCLLKDHLGLARLVVIGILIVVVSGWRPRFTGILHWWICYSWVNASLIVDGGDHVNAVLTLLLLPITLTDGRTWHWQQAPSPQGALRRMANLVAYSSLKIIRLQMAAIYLHAAVAKCAVPEWQNGTALYYWLTDPSFGMPTWLTPLVLPLLLNGHSLTFLTWGVIAFEFILFAGLFAKNAYRPGLLYAGIGFHVGIALLHGLITFGLSMIGGLILYFGGELRSSPMSFIRRFPGRRLQKAVVITETTAP